MRLKERVAIVTGGNQGIGRAIAIALAKEGARVVIVARNAARLEETVRELRSFSPASLSIQTDVGDESQVQTMVARAHGQLGRIDVLVNNAAITGPTQAAVEIPTQQWMEVLRVNFLGMVFCCREVARIMIPRKSGSIINLSSVAGKTGRALRSPYAASKAAVINFTHTLAAELGPSGIRVNAICPGTIEGERIQRVFSEKAKALGISYEAAAQMRVKETPLGRLLRAEEVAALTVFLASEEASGMTGQAINVSGGREMR